MLRNVTWFRYRCWLISIGVLLYSCSCAFVFLKVFLDEESKSTQRNTIQTQFSSSHVVYKVTTKINNEALYSEEEYWDSETKEFDYSYLTGSSCIILVWTSAQAPWHDNWPTEGTKLKDNCTITYYHYYLEYAGIVVFHQRQMVEGVLPWLFYR